ncbi:hypothetical protein [Hyphomonas sp.]|uniref:hypothetical protein n=1 Tax=Hyphomonas sp. TaxID=87 RepID=UPI00391AB3A5
MLRILLFLLFVVPAVAAAVIEILMVPTTQNQMRMNDGYRSELKSLVEERASIISEFQNATRDMTLASIMREVAPGVGMGEIQISARNRVRSAYTSLAAEHQRSCHQLSLQTPPILKYCDATKNYIQEFTETVTFEILTKADKAIVDLLIHLPEFEKNVWENIDTKSIEFESREYDLRRVQILLIALSLFASASATIVLGRQ